MSGSIAVISVADGVATAIATLADIELYLGTNDDYLAAQKTAALAAASLSIERYCDRTFAAADYCEWLKLGDDGSEVSHSYEWCVRTTNTIIPRQSPLIRLLRVAEGSKDVATLMMVNTSAVDAQASVMNGVLTLSDVVPGSARAGHADFTLSSYTSLAALAVAIAANVDINTGWALTVLLEELPKSLKPMSLESCLNAAVSLEAPFTPVRASVESLTGLITLGAPIYGWVYCEYRAGYAVIPADLVQVCCEVAADILDSANIAGGVQSERIGDVAYTYQDVAAGFGSKYGVRLAAYKKRGI